MVFKFSRNHQKSKKRPIGDQKVITAIFLPVKLIKINVKIHGWLKISNPVTAFGGHYSIVRAEN
jgi:hypothetical protein